jgi:hypothetical protein
MFDVAGLTFTLVYDLAKWYYLSIYISMDIISLPLDNHILFVFALACKKVLSML